TRRASLWTARPLYPNFVSADAATTHERRKRSTRSLRTVRARHGDRQTHVIGRTATKRRSARAPRRERAGDRWIVAPANAAATQARGHFLARHRLRIAGAMPARAPHQVDVNVIEGIGVGAGREHGREAITGRALHVMQEALLLRRAIPATLDRDHAPVGKREGGDVEGIAEGVLGDVRVRVAVHAAARIR